MPAGNPNEILKILEHYSGDERVLSVVNRMAGGQAGSARKSTLRLHGLAGASRILVLKAASGKLNGIHLLLFHEKEQAAYALNDLETLGADAVFLPSSFKRPFQTDQEDTPSIQLRAEALNRIRLNSGSLWVVTTADALAEKVITREKLEKNSLSLKKGEKTSLSFLTDLLFEYGFERADFVSEPGQFSVRGGIIDIFSFSNEFPFRVELSGDDVESIRSFDPSSQLSSKEHDEATILPNISALGREAGTAGGSLTDFISAGGQKLYIWSEPVEPLMQSINHGLETILAQEAEHLFIPVNDLRSSMLGHPLAEFGSFSESSSSDLIRFSIAPQPDFNKNFNLLESDLRQLQQKGFRHYIFCDSEKQSDRLRDIFKSISELHKAEDPLGSTELFTPVHASLQEGFIDHTLKLACYTDHQIFGRYHRFRLKSSGFKKNEALTLKMLKSLQPGDFITHIDHGVGRFGGLEKISLPSSDGSLREQECIRLVYKDNDTLYISIHALHQISRYTGKESEAPKLDKLGSASWSTLKSRTKKKIKELAFDLVKLYAERKSKKGFAFAPDNYLQNELEASFIYEDTPDQLKATNDVKRDMEQDAPMDRLVCGDVGFGKTEVAIRAAFKAALDGKQTAVLVPTTILALQHFKTFSDRLKGLPCSVDYINRFKSVKDQKETLSKLAEGKIDILIGTHRVLGKDVHFKDLGLIVVDEEQKFGVSAKEKLKLLKTNVDTLTLTATPIPRTLQFSMMGARDLSIINTPPPNRYPVQTEVHVFNEKLIRDAIDYEMQRGGQIFFVHNRVQNLEKFSEIIRHLCPKARTLVAHGQLDGAKLEKSMLDFIEGQFDVLICTTIVESGLDIPNANTMIINDAQNYGLSDLHQLRGRVGRSNKKAFCYLLTPPFNTLTNEAKKRLKAIEEFSELGSGFNVAMRDLDIRGAGNLLGAEQSGFISDIGYEMYQKILDEAMQELKEELARNEQEDGSLIKDALKKELAKEDAGKTENTWVKDCTIETDFSLLIPEEYVESTAERVALYRQLDGCKTDEDLARFELELRDRFGALPVQVKKLIEIVRLRRMAMALGFEKMVMKNGKMTAWFISNRQSSFYQGEKFTGILQKIQAHPKVFTLNEGESRLTLKAENVKDVDAAIELMRKLG